ncbi:copper amine oxidase N-terminal domain-containing protein [Paenibacillus sp. GCM10027628]|uniref:copper amine oxidase N-terminal domain-containing protein n=1 Tax=Paenibacillus sp. GCM10027628 TaxID=3273413 RepID=UPI00363E28AC
MLAQGTTLVPLRDIFESLGSRVVWDSEKYVVYAFKGNSSISIQIGSMAAYSSKDNVNVNFSILSVPPVIVNNVTMVPLRYVSESLGAGVTWDENTRTVYIRN